MKKIKIAMVVMVVAMIVAWGVKNFLPSIIEQPQQCASPRVIDDLSKELMSCYNNIDRCNKYFEACVNAYLQQDPEGRIEP